MPTTDPRYALTKGDPTAPRIVLYVEDDIVAADIAKAIKKVTYEESTTLTAETKIELANTDSNVGRGGDFADAVMWGPGNEVEVWIGYMNDMYFLARTELVRHVPRFGSDGVMTLRLRGLDKTWRMKRQELELTGGRTPRRKSKTQRRWEGTVAGFIEKIARKYGMKTDIATKFYKVDEKFIQKKGQNDYQILAHLANFHRALFKVEYRRDGAERAGIYSEKTQEASPGGAWYLVFNDFDRVTQAEAFTFKHMEGDESTVIEVEFDMSVSDNLSEVQAYYWDPTARGPSGSKGGWIRVSEETKSKRLKSVKVKAAAGETADADGNKLVQVVDDKGRPKFREVVNPETGAKTKHPLVKHAKKRVVDRSRDPFHHSYNSQRRKVRRGDTHPTLLRLAIAGHSVEIYTKPFRNAEEAKRFITSWVKSNRDNFITAKGKLPGVVIRAGETHQIEGSTIGRRYSGWYFFDSVTQSYSAEGWTTDFTAHRVFTPAWAPSATGENRVTGDEFLISATRPVDEEG